MNQSRSASVLTLSLLKISLLTQLRGATGGAISAIRRLFDPSRT
jgi:hypothetical protein